MFHELTDRFTNFVCDKNFDQFAQLFVEDGVYHDYIYGSFKGRNKLILMLKDYFYRDARDFYWEMYDHVYQENIGYAKYRFSFKSKIPAYFNKKVVISGISFFRLKYGLITEYNEVVNGGIAMVQLGVNPKTMEKAFLKWFKRSLKEDPMLEHINSK